MKATPHIVTREIPAKSKYRETTLTIPVNGVVLPQKDGTFWGLHPARIRGKILVVEAEHASALVEEAQQVLGDRSQRESLQDFLAYLNSVNIETLPRIDTGTPQRRMYDIGSDSRWQYMHNNKWLFHVNKSLQHPSLTVERVRLPDGSHLAVVLYQTW